MSKTTRRRRALIPICARLLVLSFLLHGLVTALAHEGTGRAGFKEPVGVEIESEFYAGRRGYLHGGLGFVSPLSERQKIGLVGHFVREETGGELFPSLGAEFVQEFENGFSLEAYSFGYFPVAQQNAWAAGLRAIQSFQLNEHVTIAPFIGPVFARVRAFEEKSASPVTVHHSMLLGGVAVHAEHFEFTVFASQSFFNRDPTGLETHVDLEEMTHFAAYENNDGFASHTVGGEVSYSPLDRLTLTARYALILYDHETRHSISFTPSVKVSSHLEFFAGVQLIRGDGIENDLVVGGASFGF